MHGFDGMDAEEAWPLIEELAAHATQERFIYYHSWQVGDVLMWDERATMHRGAGDYRPRRAPHHAAHDRLSELTDPRRLSSLTRLAGEAVLVNLEMAPGGAQ